jgi:hypothetical protein
LEELTGSAILEGLGEVSSAREYQLTARDEKEGGGSGAGGGGGGGGGGRKDPAQYGVSMESQNVFRRREKEKFLTDDSGMSGEESEGGGGRGGGGGGVTAGLAKPLLEINTVNQGVERGFPLNILGQPRGAAKLAIAASISPVVVPRLRQVGEGGVNVVSSNLLSSNVLFPQSAALSKRKQEQEREQDKIQRSQIEKTPLQMIAHALSPSTHTHVLAQTELRLLPDPALLPAAKRGGGGGGGAGAGVPNGERLAASGAVTERLTSGRKRGRGRGSVCVHTYIYVPISLSPPCSFPSIFL